MRYHKYYSKVLAAIGRRLAEMRENKGYSTIKEFTAKFDLPEVQYWRMEKGKANLTMKSLVKVLSIHKISLGEFFCMISTEGGSSFQSFQEIKA
jgi:transcriptional regulator with XRE-family HTH domain